MTKNDLNNTIKMCALASTTNEYLAYCSEPLTAELLKNLKLSYNYDEQNRAKKKKIDKIIDEKIKGFKKAHSKLSVNLANLEKSFSSAMGIDGEELIENYIDRLSKSLDANNN